MTRIFLSYRRADSAAETGRLADRLREEFGKNSVFLDVEDKRKGQDFDVYVKQEIENCDMMLVVIGEDWLTCTNPDGSRRINGEEDKVRIEVEHGLASGNPVTSVLVGKAEMPSKNQLPESISDLSSRTAIELREGAAYNGLLNELLIAIRAAHVSILRRFFSGRAHWVAYAVTALAALTLVLFLYRLQSTTVEQLQKLSASCSRQVVLICPQKDGGASRLKQLSYEVSVLSNNHANWNPTADSAMIRKLGFATGLLETKGENAAILRLSPQRIELINGEEVGSPLRLSRGPARVSVRVAAKLPYLWSGRDLPALHCEIVDEPSC